MSGQTIYENKATISGVIADEFKVEDEIIEENVYATRVKVKRLSEAEDYVPIIVPEEMLNLDISMKGKIVKLNGIFRSYRILGNDLKLHTKLYVFVTSINFFDSQEELDEDMNTNVVYLEGKIYNKPEFRTATNGWYMTDVLLKVKSSQFRQFAYIPCIAWGNNAYYLCTRDGHRQTVTAHGRIQSRKIKKKDEFGEQIIKEVYEMVISELEEEGFTLESDR